MAKKSDKISIRKFEDAIKLNSAENITVNWNGIDIQIKKCLSLGDMVKFVSLVVQACFDKDTGAYTPEGKDFAVRMCIVAFYTNITLPSSIEKAYNAVYESDIIDTIIGQIDNRQLDVVLQAITEKIKYIVNTRVEAINKQMAEINNVIESLGSQFNEIFEKVSPDDIAGIISTVSNGEINEEAILNAILANKSKQSGIA